MSVSLPCFNAQSDIFALTNCCGVALNLFFSDSLTGSADSFHSAQWHKISGVDVEEYAYYVNKLRQNLGLETWKWRKIVTSQTAHNKYKWPPYDPELKIPHENFLRTPLTHAYNIIFVQMMIAASVCPHKNERLLLLLQSEIPSGMCAKFRTVAASNNRDHARNLSSRTLVNKYQSFTR